MIAFILRRILIAIPLIFLASVLVFVLVVNAGDPLAGYRERPNSEDIVAQLEKQWNLDKPVHERYWIWVSDAVTGDFGVDTKGAEVAPKVFDALKITLRMVLVAFLVAIILGVAIGVFSALRQYSKFDYGFTFLAFLFFAMPVFWFAVLLKQYGAIELNNWLENPSFSWLAVAIITLLFAGVAAVIAGDDRRRKWIAAGSTAAVSVVVLLLLDGWLADQSFSRWISTVGPETPNFEGSFWAKLGDWVGHLILPTITLAVISFATYSRYQRASMLETLKSDYVRTARAKGISEKRVVFRHAFRTALIPIATLVALDFGVLLGGAIITENIFAWRGMGTMLRSAVLTDIDPNTAMAVLMITAMTVVVFNIIADIVYAYLDPRIRLE
ncbi:MAG TPA: ABC transporter permease [Acidimicrobiales bacterium]